MNEQINILLIEDNPGDAKLVEIYLRESPTIEFELTHATRLAQAIQFVEEGGVFDIALLDLTLPDSSGFETLTKAMEGLSNKISIVVLTGLDDEGIGVRAVAAGAQDYLVKGQIDTSTLTRSVLHAIERRRMQLKMEETAGDLKISEQRLLQAQNIAKIGNYELEVGSGEMYWSKQIYRILGIREGDIKAVWENYLEAVPKGDRSDVRQLIEQAITDQKPFTVEHKIKDDYSREIKYIRNQGEIKIAEQNGGKTTVKLIGTIQDITKYKKIEESLVQSEARYRNIFEESQDSIYVTTTAGKFVDFNDSFLRTLGYSAKDFTSLNEEDLYVSQEVRSEFKKRIEAEGGIRDFEVKLKKKNGKVIDCLVTSTLWKSSMDGTIRGYHGIIRDITAQKRTQELIKAKEVAERSAKMKEQFLATMSHEIRTPMNVVINMTNFLKDTRLDSQQLEYINALQLSSDTLLSLINNILDFTKIESGKLELELRPINLHDLINELIHTHKFKAKERGIDLFTLIDASLPSRVIGDSVRMHQIMNNLVSNAIKYTEKGEIQIRARVLDETPNDVHLKFEVKDTGIGIPPEKLETIFESFTQARQDTTRLYGGTGLGLSIAKQLVELFGGSIRVESEVGRGSNFIFDVHFKKDKARILQDQKQTVFMKSAVEERLDTSLYVPQEVKDEEASTKRIVGQIDILLVEDHKLNQIVASNLLRKWSDNIDLDIAENGREAIEKLNKRTYDIILMDISMPIMDGYEAAQYIRNEMASPMKDIPIIAMTAHAFNRNAEKCFEVGMNGFVSKPIKPKLLYATLNKILSEYEAKPKQGKSQVAPKKAKSIKMINLEYIESLSGGDVDLKVTMLETVVCNLPDEVRQLEDDYALRDWDKVKASAHKMKATCGYMGVSNMQDLAKTVENNAWERKDLDMIGDQVRRLCEGCREAHLELQQELESLRALQEA